MDKREFSVDDLATIAEYWLRGIEVGLLSTDKAKSWAFRIIESEADPSSDVIDVAMASNASELVSALGAVKGGQG